MALLNGPDDYEEDGPDDEADTQGLTEEGLQGIVGAEIDNAISFIESDIAPLRTDATNYYRAQPFGDEQDGRSQFISRDVHDAIGGMTPSLMRIFFGPERVVEFVPSSPQDAPMAEQATDYVNYIVTKDNPGFLIFLAIIKDALIRKVGFAKYWWDKSTEVTVSTYSGQTLEQLIMLEDDLKKSGVDAEFINGEMAKDGTASVRLKIKKSQDRVRIAALPPEEFIIDRNARGLNMGEFTLVGHRRDVPISDLVAMGYSREELEEIRGESDLTTNQERIARMPVATDGTDDDSGNASREPIAYVEAYVCIDTDGDGIAELHQFCCAGSGYKILHHEIVDDHPFAEFPCDPEPHTFFGDSVAEKMMDVQRFKSGVIRAGADSLAQSVFPATAATKGANMADVLNTEVGRIIRIEKPGDVEVLPAPPVLKDVFPMLAYMDEVGENRTGMSKVSMGLDPDALQNTTALAAANQFNKAHEHIELIARIFSETGFKRLFRGILRLITQNQRNARLVDLRGKLVQVDPRAYKADMEVTANVALGAGTEREKLAVLQQVKTTQEQILLTLGPNNPLVSLNEYFNTLSKSLAIAGFKNTTAFFKDPSQQPPMQPPAPPPDPKAQAEMAKQQNDSKRLQLDYLRHQNDMAQKSADRDQQTMLKMYEINTKAGTQLDVANIKGQFEALRIAADLHISQHADAAD